MALLHFHIRRALALFPLTLFLFSCSSYNRQVADYYANLKMGQFQKAGRALDHNRLLNKHRNRLLYFLERGKICHLLQQYDSSNQYFNAADQLMEEAKTTAKDIVLTNLMNPMMRTYQGEDFEKYLVHYYKAINYLQLGQPEEAMVEARRITLRTYAQDDKVGNRNKYSADAFSYILQGIIYEKSADINNAFIAYRNAADLFIEHKGFYYGVPLPAQLRQDVLRTARMNGFYDEESRYAAIWATDTVKSRQSDGGELILFWENGLAPVKEQQDIFFTLFKDEGGGFFFRDNNGMYNVPFDYNAGYSRNDVKLENLRSFRVALPRYREQALAYSSGSVTDGASFYQLEKAENINNLAFETLHERIVRELSSTLTRLAIKKLAEAAVRPSEKKETDSKKEKNKKDAQEAIALGLQIFNFASEKADTRNWQSLPHTIYYTRIPLRRGPNKIVLQLDGRQSSTISLNIEGKGDLQVKTVATFE